MTEVRASRFTDRELRVTAWIAGDDLEAAAVFPLTEENHLVVTYAAHEGRPSLTLAKHDAPPPAPSR